MSETTNQCDGCALGMAVNENGNHINASGRVHMNCTRDRYEVSETELIRTTFDAEVLTLDSGHEGAIVELLPKIGGRELRVPMSFEQARALGAHLYRYVRVTVIVESKEE